ncbi:hypothetical protein C4577_05700 [Candidatus Parcubacteria bacterium]|nr:MAG: hypothetical protein C4577_05700 [Candidatus Parcubacteria bacterium]
MKDSLFSQNKEMLQSLIDAASSVGIVISQSQTIDNVAASLSLYLSLKSYGKNISIVSKKEPIVELSNLVGIDKIKNSFDGAVKTFIISVPYKDQEIQKVSYNTEGDRLFLNLFAYEDSALTFSENDVAFIKKGLSPSLVFTVGIKTVEELKGLLDINEGTKIVNIDKDSSNSQFADLNYVDGSFSSVSEIMSKIISEALLPVDIDIAQNLMDGISFATNNFVSLNTSAIAFESAAFLLRYGAKRRMVNKDPRENVRQKFSEQTGTGRRDQGSFSPEPFSRVKQVNSEQSQPIGQLNEEDRINSLLTNIGLEAQNQKQKNLENQKPMKNNQTPGNWNQARSDKKNFHKQDNWNRPQPNSQFKKSSNQIRQDLDQRNINPDPDLRIQNAQDSNFMQERIEENEVPSDWLSPKIFNANKKPS